MNLIVKRYWLAKVVIPFLWLFSLKLCSAADLDHALFREIKNRHDARGPMNVLHG